MINKQKIFFRNLNKYIKKYHLINFIKSLIIATITIILIWVIAIIINFTFYLTKELKIILFILSTIISLFIIMELILIPLLPIIIENKRINYKDAAQRYAQNNYKLKDKLINIIELSNIKSSSKIISSSINQKIDSLDSINFEKQLTYKQITAVLKYLLIELAFILILFILNPNIFILGSKHLIALTKDTPKPIPIKFIIKNKKLLATEGENFTIKVQIKGKYKPKKVSIIINDKEFYMKHDNNNIYEYTIPSLRKDIKFEFQADQYKSRTYNLKVIKKPKIYSFKIKVYPPAYTQIRPSEYQNISNIKIPYGSKLIFTIVADAPNLFLDTLKLPKKNNIFSSAIFAYDSHILKLYTINHTDTNLLLTLKIETIPDQYPKIYIQGNRDSTYRYKFKGNIEDDYGFTKLEFICKLSDTTYIYRLPIKKYINSQNFLFSYDFDKLLKNYDNVIFFFKIYDNDAIKGPKATISSKYSIYKSSPKEISKKLDSLLSQITDNFRSSNDVINKIENILERIQEQLINNELSSWEKQKSLSEIINNNIKLKDLLQKIIENNQLIKQNIPLDTTLNKEQKQIEDELKKLSMQDIEKLTQKLQNLQKDKININKLNDIKYDYNYLKLSLEQKKELLKRLAIKQKLRFQAEQLNYLAEKQQELTNKLNTKNIDSIIKTQKSINDNLKQITKDYKTTLEENKKLSNPLPIKNLSDNFEKINELSNNILQNLKTGNLNEAKNMQITNTNLLKETSEKLLNNLAQAQKYENRIDINLLYKLYIDMLNISFRLDSILETKNIGTKKINDIKRQLDIAIDSLLSLGKRNPQINKPIYNQVRIISENYKDLFKSNTINKKLLNIYSSVNNLSILLSNILKTMENNMKNSSATTQNQDINQLLKQIENLQNNLEKQIKKSSQQQKQTEGQKEILNALKLLEELQKLLNQLLKNNSLDPKIQKIINEIKKLNQKTEEEIIQQNITQNTYNRQLKIKIKLLEAQKAINKQNKDYKRKAQTATEVYRKKNNIKTKDIQNYTINTDIIKFNKTKLKRFYQNIYSNYISQIQ